MAGAMKGKVKGLKERLKDGETIIAAEGYLFEFQRRGYLRAGAFVPEVVLEYPELVKNTYREFVHAGSDVVLAFTYYAHREKMRVVGREDDLAKINMDALRMAREVADETGTLMAGNICNTTIYDMNDPSCIPDVKNIFKEQIEWAVEGGADFMVGETFGTLGEAMIALEMIKEHGKGLPAVINIATHLHKVDGEDATFDGVKFPDACKKLEEAGATVVGVNCTRGPETLIPIVRKIKDKCKIPISALPVMYRTTEKEPSFQSLTDPKSGKRVFPNNLNCVRCNNDDITWFAEQCKDIGVQYVGLCCGNSADLTRTLAESLGRSPPASRYTTDMSQHYVYGSLKSLKKVNTEILAKSM
ncbi:betaine--homocysteine S-methyltransferase 1-like [Ptychodera flava]|uniref:betaine--homocysteine S-methyltransferase 1-like n=1 Tax=Ptychodera flava TaxID=63121 RepID=UPI00396A4B25